MNGKAKAQRRGSVSGFKEVNYVGTVAACTMQSLLWALIVEVIALANAVCV